MLADIRDLDDVEAGLLALRDLVSSRRQRQVRRQFGAAGGHAAGTLQLLLRHPGCENGRDRVHRARIRGIDAAGHRRGGAPRRGELFALLPQGGQGWAQTMGEHVMRLVMMRVMRVMLHALCIGTGRLQGRLRVGRTFGSRAAVLRRRRVHRVLRARST